MANPAPAPSARARPPRAAGEAFPRVPRWAAKLATELPDLPEFDMPDDAPLDLPEDPDTLRRARKLLRLADEHGLPAEKLRPLLEAWDRLLGAKCARLQELQAWDVAARLRARVRDTDPATRRRRDSDRLTDGEG